MSEYVNYVMQKHKSFRKRNNHRVDKILQDCLKCALSKIYNLDKCVCQHLEKSAKYIGKKTIYI